MRYDLPTSVTICGETYAIRSDFRVILDIFEVLNDPELTDSERGGLTLLFFYPDFAHIPPQHTEEAVRQCFWFINGGQAEPERSPHRVMDWAQDFPYIVAPINRVVGQDVRGIRNERGEMYFHWWSFLAAFMEIGECTFAQIVRIRTMQANGKPLDDADREWCRQHPEMVALKQRYTEEENAVLSEWGVM